MLKVKKSPLHQLQRLAWDAIKKIQKTHKRKLLCSCWMQAMGKWFGNWDVTHLLHDTSIHSLINDVLFNAKVSCHEENVEAHVHVARVYTTNVAPNFKTMFFTKHGNHKHQYKLEPILLPCHPIHCFHATQVTLNMGVRQGVGAQVMRVIDYAHFNLNVLRVSQCDRILYIDHIGLCFPHILLAQISSTISMCTLNNDIRQ